MMRFSWITGEQELDALRDDWRALDDGDGPHAVFRSWEWLATWWRTLGRAGGRELRVLVARDDDGRPRAILPMYLEDAPIARLIPRRRLRLLGDLTVGSDYLGLVAPRADLAALAPAVVAEIGADAGLERIDLLELYDIGEDDALAGALADGLAAAGFVDVDLPRRYTCPVADFGDDLEVYLASRPQKFGSQVRRRRAELARKPGFRLEILERPDEVVAGLDELFRLHRARWHEEGGSEAFTDARVEDFHRRAGRLLAERGFARLCLLHVEGRAVAAGYGFLRGRRFAYYQAGLDPAWRRRSAGMVVMVELMRHAWAGGARELDFLRGDEAYKNLWATDARHTIAVSARRATRSARRAARAMALLADLRARVKAILPEPAVAQLRRLRRGIS